MTEVLRKPTKASRGYKSKKQQLPLVFFTASYSLTSISTLQILMVQINMRGHLKELFLEI